MNPDLRDHHLQKITEAIADAFEAGAISTEHLPITIAAAASDVRTGKIVTFTVALSMGWTEAMRLEGTTPTLSKKRGN